MKKSIKLELIRIGNSKGLRLPSWLIDTLGFEKTINVVIGETELVLSPEKKKREGWDQSFQKMAKNSDDILLDQEFVESEWDKEEWAW